MIGYPVKDEKAPYTLSRSYYWPLLILLAMMNSMPSTIFTLFWPGLVAGWFFISYARIKDIGWSGWWCLCALIPLFNIIIGFMPTKPSPYAQFQPH